MDLKKIFMHKNENNAVQFGRYVVAALLGNLADVCLLMLLTEVFDIHYLISAMISYFVGMVDTYFLSVYWAFANRSVKNRFMEFLLFFLFGFIGMGINELVLWIFTDLMDFYFMISKIISMLIGFFVKYILRKNILFKKNKSNAESNENSTTGL